VLRIDAVRSRVALAAPLGVVLALLALVWAPRAAFAHPLPCSRIEVRSQDREITLSTYIVSAPLFVAKMHHQIDLYGRDGVWTVSAGDLGSVGYTVRYTCLAPAESGIASTPRPTS
jgi:hypothetical protein